jgi:hypothetical protein
MDPEEGDPDPGPGIGISFFQILDLESQILDLEF